jgi:hypothetical protein
MTLGTNQFGLSVVNQSALTIGSGATDPIVFRRNISTTTNVGTGDPVGLLENSVNKTTAPPYTDSVLATVSGTTNYTLTITEGGAGQRCIYKNSVVWGGS